MRLSALTVQGALFTRLNGAVVLVSADGALPVYDHVPQDAAFPYIMIGEMTGSQWNTKTQDGDEQTISVHCFSQYNGMSQVKQMMDEVTQLVTGSALDLSSGTFSEVLLRLEYFEAFLEGDGRTRHGVLRFRLLVEDEV